jgi:hypothetical protein
MDRKYLTTYLSLGVLAIVAATYLGAAIPSRFCPNYVYHFPVANGWPTDDPSQSTANPATAQGFLHEFEHLPLISWKAQQHARIELDLYQPVRSDLLPLQTRDQRSSATHRSKTPTSTAVPMFPKLVLPVSK